MYLPDTYPRTYTPLDTYPWTHTPGYIPPGHLPPGHLPPGQIPPRTYTPWTHTQRTYNPHNLKCLFCVDYLLNFKRNIYFARIAFICNVDAVKLTHICCEEGFSPHSCSDSRWAFGGGGEPVPISDVNFDKYLLCLS